MPSSEGAPASEGAAASEGAQPTEREHGSGTRRIGSKDKMDFGTYFHRRASRFAALYRSETVARLIGRGPLFDRARQSVEWVEGLQAAHVLDVGCGSGPLFAPLAERGVRVTGIDPAPAMIALARDEAARYLGAVTVEQRGWEQLGSSESYDVAVALGVFDYVESAALVLSRLAQVAPSVIASFPSPGLRLNLRKIRYGAHGVKVSGYTKDDLEQLASGCKLHLVKLVPLGRAGHLALFAWGVR
jgi:SAM-dependent methyltransferase